MLSRTVFPLRSIDQVIAFNAFFFHNIC